MTKIISAKLTKKEAIKMWSTINKLSTLTQKDYIEHITDSNAEYPTSCFVVTKERMAIGSNYAYNGISLRCVEVARPGSCAGL